MIRRLAVVLGAALSLGPGGALAAGPLTLDAALQVAEANAPQVRQGRASVAVASARIARDRQFANPEVRLGVDIPDGQDELPRVEAALRMKLDHPADRVARRSRRTEELAQASMRSASDLREVERGVRLLFVEHAHLRRSLGLVTRGVALHEERVRLTQDAIPYGEATPVDIRRARRALLLEQREVRQLRRALAEVEAELAALIGLPLEEVSGLVRHALARPAPLPQAPTLLAHALASSQELQLGNRVIAERKRQVKAARWSAAPWTNFVQLGRSFPTPDRAGGTEVVVGVSVPLLSLGIRSRKAAEASTAAATLARSEHAATLQREVMRWAQSARLAADEYAELSLTVASLQALPPGTTALQQNEESVDQLLFEAARLDAQRDYARAQAELYALQALSDGGPHG